VINPFITRRAKIEGISYEEAEEKVKKVVNCINCRYLPKNGYGECKNPENKKLVKTHRKVISSAENDTCSSFAPKIENDSKPKTDINAKIDSILAINTFRTARDSELIYLFKPELGYFVRGESYINEICANDLELNKPNIRAIIEMNIMGKTYRERKYLNNIQKWLILKMVHWIQKKWNYFHIVLITIS